jgi:hypothetical protein
LVAWTHPQQGRGIPERSVAPADAPGAGRRTQRSYSNRDSDTYTHTNPKRYVDSYSYGNSNTVSYIYT